MAGRLVCPHCQAPVVANPIGHWFQRFQCPHCKGRLQFNALTNNLGMASWAGFAAMMLSLVLGRASWTPWFSAACGAVFVASLLLSYQLRGISKG